MLLLLHMIQFGCGAIGRCATGQYGGDAKNALVRVSAEVSVDNTPASNDRSLSRHNQVIFFFPQYVTGVGSAVASLCRSWWKDIFVERDWSLLVGSNCLGVGNRFCIEKYDSSCNSGSLSIVNNLEVEPGNVSHFKMEKFGGFYPNPRPLVLSEVFPCVAQSLVSESIGPVCFDGVPDDRTYGNELKGGFPPRRFWIPAFIGLLVGWWGWHNIRNDRRLFWGTCAFLFGIILWGYEIYRFLEWSG